ncbi:MAG TPA: response regulator transcription factor [Dermatophilaceae bacterium]|nr:response regulator transcription factor [Dermatophilaceae bacterium]
MARVLVVDDDPTVREVVSRYLEHAGFAVSQADEGQRALALAAAEPPDIAVLDLMLPGVDGLEVLRRLRRRRGDLPVVLLSARGEEDDRVLGLQVGADDYVTKPFSPRELVLRVQSVLRRAQPSAPSSGLSSGSAGPAAPLLADADLVVTPSARTATLAGAALPLTTRELDLLIHFLSHPGRAFTRQELMRQVWGWEFGDESTVTVHVRRLREKIEPDPGAPQRICTVWGVGYRWDGLAGASHPEQPS